MQNQPWQNLNPNVMSDEMSLCIYPTPHPDANYSSSLHPSFHANISSKILNSKDTNCKIRTVCKHNELFCNEEELNSDIL